MKIIHLFCLFSFILSSACWAEKTKKGQTTNEKLKAERKSFIGVIKSRTKKDDEYTYYYIELEDESKINISRSVENVDLKKYLKKRVEIETRLRVKTDEKAKDFIKQIFSIKKVKTEGF